MQAADNKALFFPNLNGHLHAFGLLGLAQGCTPLVLAEFFVGSLIYCLIRLYVAGQDLIDMIDTSMADYPEIGPIKNERATSTIGWSSETELADEDWARVRTALEEATKQE